MKTSSYSRIEKFVGIEKPPTRAVSTFEASNFTATRVRWDHSEGGHPTQFDRADGYMICLQRLGIPAHPYWVDDRPMSLDTMHRGQFLLLDLDVKHGSLVPGDVDCVSIFFSRDTLGQFQAENAWFPEMQGGMILRTHAFFDAIAFDDLWRRVKPARNRLP